MDNATVQGRLVSLVSPCNLTPCQDIELRNMQNKIHPRRARAWSIPGSLCWNYSFLMTRAQARDQLTRAPDPDPAPGPQNMGIFSDRYIFLGLFCQTFYRFCVSPLDLPRLGFLAEKAVWRLKALFVLRYLIAPPCSTHIKFIEAKTLSSAKTWRFYYFADKSLLDYISGSGGYLYSPNCLW